MSEQEELERLRRLREQQLGARDPEVKQRAYASRMAKRYKPNYFSDILKDPPYKVRWALGGVVIGFLLGLFIGFIVDYTFQSQWIGYIAFGLLVWGAIVGFIMGRGRDSGNEGWR